MPIERSKLHPSVENWYPELANICNSENEKDTTVSFSVKIRRAKTGKFCEIEYGGFIRPDSAIEDGRAKGRGKIENPL